MPARSLDGEIERLYRLPSEEFTAARNALAKQAGSDAGRIRGLTKPPLAAWVVNQLYWQRRAVYDALVGAAQRLRAAHKGVLAGKGGDLRAAGAEHEAELEEATRGAVSILADTGNPATDATRQAIITTLRALPVDEPPGRLSRTLQPGGFEMLAGLTIGKGPTATRVKKPPPPPPRPKDTGTSKDARATAAAEARSREAAAAAARRIREAEHAVKREEFELARATREADKAEKTAASARTALEEAQQALEDAEAAVATAVRARESAERRATKAEQTLRDLSGGVQER